MPRDLKLFYFAFFLMRGRAKKILVIMIRNSSCKFDNVANVYVWLSLFSDLPALL